MSRVDLFEVQGVRNRGILPGRWLADLLEFPGAEPRLALVKSGAFSG
jgi:hypothetical protein